MAKGDLKKVLEELNTKLEKDSEAYRTLVANKHAHYLVVDQEKLKKQIELEKAKKPGYWELFAAFYYKDENAPLYCRKYARPDSWFKRPGNACLTPNGDWVIIK